MNLQELMHYCASYEAEIVVRDEIDGKWQSITFKDLPEEKQMQWVQRWWDNNQMPVRMKRSHEGE